MDRNLGLGPVFFYECLAASRRWQVYATRAGFVAVLIAVLAALWVTEVAGVPTSKRMAKAGETFFYTITFLELTAVLLVAPAATAGAICLDRARGSLAHLMSTELSSSEIVLGKLVARLLPSIGLVIATVPIMALSSLLGGIDVAAMIGAGLVTIGVAAVGSSLAMVLSLRGRRPHEVLIVTYMILFAWVLVGPVLWLVAEFMPWALGGTRFESFVASLFPINPYGMAYGPYWEPGRGWFGSQALFLLACVAISAGLSAIAISQIRRVAFLREIHRARLGLRGALANRVGRILPGPAIDRNPVLWRQWHYTKPSIGSRIARSSITVLVLVLAAALIVPALLTTNAANSLDERILLIDMLYLFFALLFLSVNAPMALAEERTRGSLDILLSTPLSTPSIVWAKWWGIFRSVPPLVVIPGVMQLLLANPDRRWLGFFVSSALLLASGALITSFGLAVSLATPRLGRAIGLSVGGYVAMTLGAYFFGAMAAELFGQSNHRIGLGLVEGTPCFGVGIIANESTEKPMGNTVVALDLEENWRWLVGFGIGWTLFYASMAAVLYAAVLLLFDRCLGRVRQGRVEADSVVPSGKRRQQADRKRTLEWAT
ncbi:MAG: ABC transporter permease subunit [Isosphaeraceae bacterium]